MNVNETWIALFRLLPADLHDALALGLTTGAEIIMQKIIRLDPEFMIIRGRVSGTTDTGRVIMIPYPQVTYVAIGRELKDAAVEAIFGQSAPVGAAVMPAPTEPAPGAEAAKVSEPAAAVNAPAKPEPNKKALLEKLRGQLKGK